MESRYSESEYLISYCLNIRIFDEYDIEVKDIVPLRNVYVLYTDNGTKILKKLSYSKERFAFIDEALDYVKKKYPFTLEFQKNIYEGHCIDFEGEVYVLINCIEGRECEVYNPVDIQRASGALGRLHLASMGILDHMYSMTSGKEENMSLGIFPLTISKNIQLIDNLLERLKDFANYNDFDKLFISSSDKIKNSLLKCLELLEESDYKELCRDMEAVVLCHGDLAHHNIIIKEEEVWFLDFDYCSIDLRVKDIADFIDKSIKGCGYDMDKCRDILASYQKEVSLSLEEMKLLYIWLMYPRDLISLLKGYYNKEKNWEYKIFLDRFTKKLQGRSDKENFLEEFYDEYLRR